MQPAPSASSSTLPATATTAAWWLLTSAGAEAFHEVARRLAAVDAPAADLRDLPGEALDLLTPQAWEAMITEGVYPPRIALKGCNSTTVQRVLATMPDLQMVSIDGLTTPTVPLDLQHAKRLRLLETSTNLEVLNLNAPVLLRPSDMPPTFLPVAAATPSAELVEVEGMRRAMANGECQLLPMSAKALRSARTQTLNILHKAQGLIARGLAPFAQEDAERLASWLEAAPAALLPAPAAHAIRHWATRLRCPAMRCSCTGSQITQLQGFLLQVYDVICPETTPSRPRTCEQLETLARLQAWAWPDTTDYGTCRPLSLEQQARKTLAVQLRQAWEHGSGPNAVSQALNAAADRPSDQLLDRMGLLFRQPMPLPALRRLELPPSTRP
ncbi:hypothetical protein [Roseateles sp. MS654]|uniref:hypothetical protein n=1 Tax=Roseateles sp. MS654 TaxID=3412685 RepID=UPI003C2FA0EC